MNAKSLLVCLFAATFAASITLAQTSRNGGFASTGSSTTMSRGAVTQGSTGFNHAPVTSNSGRWNGNWNGWRGDWHHHDRFFFAGSFGFPFWGYPGWGWGYPGWGYSYYPYGYYGGGYYGGGYYPGAYPGGYYSGGGYGSGSDVAQLQRRLKASGYYHASIDGIMGPRTRSALRAYQRDRGVADYNQGVPRPY
jgi:Putative peptidoglycan binding domain